MVNVIVVLVLLAIAAGVVWYLVRAKNRGEACIGCPYCKKCGGTGKHACGQKSVTDNNSRDRG